MARFGQGDAPRMNGSGRKWSSDELTLKPSERDNTCRVCRQPIAEGELSWAFAWNAGERSHEACGYYALRDVWAVALAKALLARWAGGPKLHPTTLIAARDAFLIYMSGDVELGVWVERPKAATIHLVRLHQQMCLASQEAPALARAAVSNVGADAGADASLVAGRRAQR